MTSALRCATCGTLNAPDDFFCGECGSALDESMAVGGETGAPPAHATLRLR